MAENHAPGRGCLSAVLEFLGLSNRELPGTDSYPFEKKDAFLSPAEIQFFKTLLEIVEDDYLVFCKVRLGDLFFVKKPF